MLLGIGGRNMLTNALSTATPQFGRQPTITYQSKCPVFKTIANFFGSTILIRKLLELFWKSILYILSTVISVFCLDDLRH